MTIIQTIFVCPRCEENITSIDTAAKCPSCGLPLGHSEVEPYTPPYTFTEQHHKLQDAKLLASVLADLDTNKMNSIVNDALSIFETISGKNCDTPDISTVMKMGMRIGEIAKAYDSYLMAGGKHVPAFFVKTKTTSGEQNGITKENRTRE